MSQDKSRLDKYGCSQEQVSGPDDGIYSPPKTVVLKTPNPTGVYLSKLDYMSQPKRRKL